MCWSIPSKGEVRGLRLCLCLYLVDYRTNLTKIYRKYSYIHIHKWSLSPATSSRTSRCSQASQEHSLPNWLPFQDCHHSELTWKKKNDYNSVKFRHWAKVSYGSSWKLTMQKTEQNIIFMVLCCHFSAQDGLWSKTQARKAAVNKHPFVEYYSLPLIFWSTNYNDRSIYSQKLISQN